MIVYAFGGGEERKISFIIEVSLKILKRKQSNKTSENINTKRLSFDIAEFGNDEADCRIFKVKGTYDVEVVVTCNEN